MSTLFYIGDSTVAFNKFDTYPQTGIAQAMSLFLADGVALEARGRNGYSTKSFLDEGWFSPVAAAMAPGDLLLIQFGHNDEKDDPARHTDPNTSFSENLRLFLGTARGAEALPVLITPVARRRFSQHRFCPGSHGAYPAAVRRVGREEGVPVLDLTAQTEALVEALGDEASKPLYMWPKDNTHLKPAGAVRMAEMVCRGLYDLGGAYRAFLDPKVIAYFEENHLKEDHQ